MATDQTEPPVKKILTIGVLAIVFLAGSEYFFQSYFNSMYGAELQSQVYGVTPTALLNERRDEDRRLHNGPVPIDQAMAAFARGERPASINPRGSTDYAAMHGWTLLPRPFEPNAPAPAPTPVVPAPAVVPSPAVTGPAVQAPAPPLGPGMPAPMHPVAPAVHPVAPAVHPVQPAAVHPAVAPAVAPGGNP